MTYIKASNVRESALPENYIDRPEDWVSRIYAELSIRSVVSKYNSINDLRQLEFDGFVYRAEILLHTDAARNLVTGFKDESNNLKSQIGLSSYNRKIKTVCRESINDNPLADAVLLATEQQMTELRQNLLDIILDVRATLLNSESASVAAGAFPEELPGHRVTFSFKYPYTFEFSRAVNFYDALCVLLMVLYKNKRITRDMLYKIKRRFSRQFRSIVKLMETWDSRIAFRRNEFAESNESSGRNTDLLLNEIQLKKLKEYKESRNIEVTQEIIDRQCVPEWLADHVSRAHTNIVL